MYHIHQTYMLSPTSPKAIPSTTHPDYLCQRLQSIYQGKPSQQWLNWHKLGYIARRQLAHVSQALDPYTFHIVLKYTLQSNFNFSTITMRLHSTLSSDTHKKKKANNTS